MDTARVELSNHVLFNLDGCVSQDLPFLRLDFDLWLVYISVFLIKMLGFSLSLERDLSFYYKTNRAKMVSQNIFTLCSFWSHFSFL